MNIKTFIFFIFIACSVSLQAQHCGYDTLQIIGMFPHAEDSQEIIHGLKITLVDENGQTVLLPQEPYVDEMNKFPRKSTPFVAWRNQTVDPDIKHKKRNIKRRFFGFVNNHYIMVANFWKKAVFVKIEDVDNEHNGGHFETKIVAVPRENILGLCGYRVPSTKHQKAYNAFEIILTKVQKDTTDTNKQVGDYNFDGLEDYRISIQKTPYKQWDYYLYDSRSNSFVKDNFLSSMYYATFDWVHTAFSGTRSFSESNLSRTNEHYDFFEGTFRVVSQQICVQKSENSERSDCSFYKLKDGKLVFDEFVQGAE